MATITRSQRDDIFNAVKSMYTDVASCPDKAFHFPTGRAACEYLGYPAGQLDALPASAVGSFAGVGNPLGARRLPPGSDVLDIGSGSGTDTLLAAMQVGPDGHVYGLDLTRAMLDRLVAHAALLGLDTVEALEGNAEKIPLPDGSVDVVISNGVINLVPDKPAVFAELYRVVRPGGRLQICDVAIGKNAEIIEAAREMAWLWAECIVGAVTEPEYRQLVQAAGFSDVRLHSRQDYFARSPSEKTREVANNFQAHSVIIEAIHP
jgi:ubiquinone/menaquinone biosynthesis C-methylase UbiE